MKISVKRNLEQEAKRLSDIRAQNLQELNCLKGKLRMSVVPEDVQKLVESQIARVDHIRVMTLEELKARNPNADETKTVGFLESKNTKTSFPIFYVYSPNLLEILEKIKEKHGREVNASRLSNNLKRRYGIDASESFKSFVMALPAELPSQVFFDGNFQRVHSLTQKPNTMYYPPLKADNTSYCAVQHYPKLQDIPALTIFVPEIDYKKDFADKLSRRLNLSPEIANAISAHLDHSTYYAIQDTVEQNAQEFARRMAWLLKAKEDDTFTNLISGEQVEVFQDPINKEMSLDIDDEEPSAFLVWNRVNVFLPLQKE